MFLNLVSLETLIYIPLIFSYLQILVIIIVIFPKYLLGHTNIYDNILVKIFLPASFRQKRFQFLEVLPFISIVVLVTFLMVQTITYSQKIRCKNILKKL